MTTRNIRASKGQEQAQVQGMWWKMESRLDRNVDRMEVQEVQEQEQEG